MTEETPEAVMKRGWTIDKRISISTLILFATSVCVNISVGSWEVSKMDSRIATLETDAVLNRMSREKVVNLEGEIAAIKSYLSDIKDNDLKRIEATLDHMIWDNPKRPNK